MAAVEHGLPGGHRLPQRSEGGVKGGRRAEAAVPQYRAPARHGRHRERPAEERDEARDQHGPEAGHGPGPRHHFQAQAEEEARDQPKDQAYQRPPPRAFPDPECARLLKSRILPDAVLHTSLTFA